MATNEEFHLGELAIALNPADPRHISPPPLPASKKVLDIGCGAGQTLIAAYPDRISYGIDIDAGALKLGTRLTGGVRFVRSRAEYLPFGDSQFDLVTSRVAIPYTDIQSTLKEIRRVLKPGGALWVTLHTFSMVVRNLNLRTLRSHLSFAYVLANSALFHLTQQQFRVMDRCESFQTPKSIQRALEQNGFENIKISLGKHFVVQARALGLEVLPRKGKPSEDVLTLPTRSGSEAA